MDKRELNFHYNHLVPHGHAISPGPWRPRPVTCLDCQAEFIATSPLQKRCPLCQEKAKARTQARAAAKLKAKRRARRAA